MAENEWKYRLEFASGGPVGFYLSPDIRMHNPGWGDDLFNYPITKLEFFLPTGHTILMQGMASYNFFIEATQSFTPGNNAKINAVYLCGLFPGADVVDVWRVGNGTVTHSHQKLGLEYEGTATRGWKAGIPDNNYVSTVVEGQ